MCSRSFVAVPCPSCLSDSALSDSAEKILSSPIKELVITNTVKLQPAVERLDKVTQLTLAPLLAETIRRIYQKRSISGLYQSPITAPASATMDKRP